MDPIDKTEIAFIYLQMITLLLHLILLYNLLLNYHYQKS